MLPKAHLINLDRSQDRLARFRKWNAHLQDIVRVTAVDGGKLDRMALVRSGHITEDVPYGAGTLGCALSHIKLWEQAACGDPLTVFEDDVVASRHFQRIASHVLAELPADWDFVHWGYWLTKRNLFTWVDLGTTRVRLSPYGIPRWRSEAEYPDFQERAAAVAAVPLIHSYGLLSYSISPKGARRALDHCLPLRKRTISFEDGAFVRQDDGLDVTLCGLYADIKAFIALPQLVVPYVDQPSVRRDLDAREHDITVAR